MFYFNFLDKRDITKFTETEGFCYEFIENYERVFMRNIQLIGILFTSSYKNYQLKSSLNFFRNFSMK